MNEAQLKSRIDQLTGAQFDMKREDALTAELVIGATTILEAVYGKDSEQLDALKSRIAVAQKSISTLTKIEIFFSAQGALKAAKADIEAGLIGSLRRTITGEVLGDLLALAKDCLSETAGDSGKNVAAVLAAAAFEDAIRRMGSTLAGINGPVDLQEIVVTLKNQAILQGSQVGVVQAHLQFRNHALHANWEKIDRPTVSTALQLVQELLLKHF